MPATAADSTWTLLTAGNASGGWTNTANWSGGTFADGADFTANFATLDLTADSTLTLDGARTIGNLTFGDTDTTSAAGWILNTGTGGPLTLSVTTGKPTITVGALGTGKATTIGAVLAGSGGYVKSGVGLLSLTATNTVSGGITVSQGSLTTTVNGGFGGNTITLGDVNTGANDILLGLDNRADVANPIVVSADGTGAVVIAGLNTGTGANASIFSGLVTLNRATTFRGLISGDRLAFDGKLTGNVGTLTIDGGSRTTFSNTTNDFVGNMVITGTGTTFQASVGGVGNVVPDGTSVTVNAGAFFWLAAASSVTETIDALNGAGTVTMNGAVAGTNVLAVGSAGGTGVFTGVIANADADSLIAFTKLGAGSQTLSGTNTYTGATTLVAGSLLAGNNSAFGTSSITINTAATGASNTSLLIDGSGGNRTIARPITVANQGTGVVTIGSSVLNGSSGTALFSGAIVINKDVTLTGATGDRTDFSGGITGTGNITVGGAGRVILRTTTSTYSGTTTVDGLLQLSDGGATAVSLIPDASNLIVNATKTFRMAKGGNSETVGGLSGTGAIQAVSGADTLIVGGGDATASFGGTMLNNGAVLSFGKTGTGTQTLTGTGTYTGTTVVNGGTLLLNNAAIGFDAGLLSGTSSITVNSTATLQVGQQWNVKSSTPIVLNGGTLNFTSGTATDGVNYANVVTLNNGATVTGNPFRGGNLTNPTYTVTGDATSTIAARMYLTNNADLTGVRVATFNVADGASTVDLLVSGVVSDLGQNGTSPNLRGSTVVKSGAGTASFTNANTYLGQTQINAGKLLANNLTGSAVGTGNVTINGGALGGSGTVGLTTDASNVTFGANGGTIAPGNSPGVLTINGDVDFTTAGVATFAVELNGSVFGTEYDRLVVNSAAGGTNLINLSNALLQVALGFTPTVGAPVHHSRQHDRRPDHRHVRRIGRSLDLDGRSDRLPSQLYGRHRQRRGPDRPIGRDPGTRHDRRHAVRRARPVRAPNTAVARVREESIDGVGNLTQCGHCHRISAVRT
ncbi:MAG: autotransporter-associated beta strand repeat-containing protein [Pirellulales bacterium]